MARDALIPIAFAGQPRLVPPGERRVAARANLGPAHASSFDARWRSALAGTVKIITKHDGKLRCGSLSSRPVPPHACYRERIVAFIAGTARTTSVP